MNDMVHENIINKYKIDEKIIDIIVYRGWENLMLRHHIARLMM